jgi:hypothetical protein
MQKAEVCFPVEEELYPRTHCDRFQLPDRHPYEGFGSLFCGSNGSATASPLRMRIADTPLGDKLEPEHIAHNDDVQKLMDAMGISWGVQYELARGVTLELWSWEEVLPERLSRLVGSNGASAYRVAHVMLGRPLSKNVNLALWCIAASKNVISLY